MLFDRLNLGRVKDVLMGAYHRSGPGRPPFKPFKPAPFQDRPRVEGLSFSEGFGEGGQG